MKATIRQQNYWTNLGTNILTPIKVFNSCPKKKEQSLNYSKLPAKEAEAIQWDRLLVYLIGLYKIRRDGCDNPLILKYLTIKDWHQDGLNYFF